MIALKHPFGERCGFRVTRTKPPSGVVKLPAHEPVATCFAGKVRIKPAGERRADAPHRLALPSTVTDTAERLVLARADPNFRSHKSPQDAEDEGGGLDAAQPHRVVIRVMPVNRAECLTLK